MNDNTPVAEKSIYLDPCDCDSVVSYKVIYEIYGKADKHLRGTFSLSDCSRKIDWYFGNNNQRSVEKIDKAILMLREFRAAYIRELKVVEKEKAKEKAKTP